MLKTCAVALGPFRVAPGAVGGATTERGRDRDDQRLAVRPGAPAKRLAGDPMLVGRTCTRAPGDRLDATEKSGVVASGVGDEDRGGAAHECAHGEAGGRAEEWGPTDHLADDPAT
jgi:hypothetical protein